MTDPPPDIVQPELFDAAEGGEGGEGGDEAATRALLDQLIEDSRLYRTSSDYFELLQFVSRLRNFAPFNAMLLQVQKPGILYAASAADWRDRFGRFPKEGARPLLTLWPFGPVALVYDVQETEGDELPEDVDSFFAKGEITGGQVKGFISAMGKMGIHCSEIDGGDASAGSIRIVGKRSASKEGNTYRMNLNRNHSAAVQFVTIAHELAHLFLGHLGEDKRLKVPRRPEVSPDRMELEAESLAYLVCSRSGVESKSETYLADYVEKNTDVDQLDVYQIMRAAGQIETLLGLTSRSPFGRVEL